MESDTAGTKMSRPRDWHHGELSTEQVRERLEGCGVLVGATGET